MMKTRLNLYSDILLPAKLKLSFERLGLGAIALLVVALLLGVLGYSFLQSQASSLADAKRIQSEFTQQKQTLEAKIAAHLPAPELVAQVERETQQLELKRLLLNELSHRQGITSRGFAPLLTDLASVANSDTWLSRIVVEENSFVFEGYAQRPEHVPTWINRLKSTTTLKGQAFAAMTMSRGDNEPLAFMLTSKADESKETSQ